jgi:hypothetical protein
MKIGVIAVAIVAALVAAPAGCDRDRGGPSTSGSQPPPAVGVPGIGNVVDQGGKCPPTTALRFVGQVHAPGSDAKVNRPVSMTINQHTEAGNPGTVKDPATGHDRPGVGFRGVGTSPMTYCLRSLSPGTVIHANVSFELQTNIPGYVMACVAYGVNLAGDTSILDYNEEVTSSRADTARATCDATWVVGA